MYTLLAPLILVAVVIELRTGKIPNWLSMTGVAVGFGLACFDGDWTTHVVGLLVGFVLGLSIFLPGAAGAGYVKLLTAVGTMCGLVAAIASTVIAGLVLLYIKIGQSFEVPDELRREGERKAAAIAHGSLIVAAGTVTAVAMRLMSES